MRGKARRVRCTYDTQKQQLRAISQSTLYEIALNPSFGGYRRKSLSFNPINRYNILKFVILSRILIFLNYHDIMYKNLGRCLHD